MTIGITYHLSPYQIRRAERLGLKAPPPGFYRVEQNGKYRNLENNRLYAKRTVENARFGRPSERKGWDSLSASYRRRLEKSGITRSSYNAGARLATARGHLDETLPKSLRQFTTRGDTDYYRVPASDRNRGRLLAYLRARGYQAIRAIYERDGKHESGNWIVLDKFNLSRITERYINESFQYKPGEPIYSPADLILFAVVPTRAKQSKK